MVLSKSADFLRKLCRRQAAEPQGGSGGRRPPENFDDFDMQKKNTWKETNRYIAVPSRTF